MSFDYAALADEVATILAEFGDTAATLTRNAPNAYAPTTGVGTLTTTTQTVTAVVFPYGDKFVDGKHILSTDRQAFISAADVTEPRAGDVLTWGSELLTVVRSKNLGPARTMVLYEAQVRSGS